MTNAAKRIYALDAWKECHRQIRIASVRTLIEGIGKTSPPVEPKDVAAERLEDFTFDLAIRQEVFSGAGLALFAKSG